MYITHPSATPFTYRSQCFSDPIYSAQNCNYNKPYSRAPNPALGTEGLINTFIYHTRGVWAKAADIKEQHHFCSEGHSCLGSTHMHTNKSLLE